MGMPQEQNRTGLIKAQSGQYLIMSGLGYDNWSLLGCI